MNKSYDVYMCRGSRLRIEAERQLADACGSINNYSPLKYWADWQTINGGRPAAIAKKEVNESFHEKGVTQKILNWLRLK